jgi:hypothetical protein
MGRSLALVSAWPARHSTRMVNGKFPDRAGHGFEMVDLDESCSPETGIIRNSTREFGNFFANPARIKPNAITCDLSRNVSQALDCETTVID